MSTYMALVFVTGAFIMTIELVASRLVAPVLGVSLYTWTSVIGVVLLGISLGNFTGGMIADRIDPKKLLGPILLMCGIAVMLIVPSLSVLHRALPDTEYPLLRVLTPIAVLFGIPSLAMGTVSPVVYRLAIRDLSKTGTTVGRLAGSNALGSIVGTFATGFWLIPSFGTHAVAMGVATGFFLLAVLTFEWRSRAMAAITLVTVLVSGSIGVSRQNASHQNAIIRESAYYRIAVTSQHTDGRVVKQLILDSLVHSVADPDDPEYLWYDYERVAAWVVENTYRENYRALFVGGGAYTLPHWLESRYPNASVHVIEIDPEVTRIAFEHFVTRPSGIVTYNEDGRTAVRQLAGQKYDLVFGDAFNDVSVPYHLTTLEFAKDIKSCLSSDGLYMANIVDWSEGQFLNAFGRTLSSVFKHVVIIPASAGASSPRGGPHIVLASMTNLNIENWSALEGIPFRLRAFEPEPKGLILTDDYAPTDFLLLPVFARRMR